MLGKSEGIMKWMFIRKISITMQMNMKQGKVKTQTKRKIQNAFSAKKPS